MSIRYYFDDGLQRKAEEISKKLFPHINIERVKCFRSVGSSSSNTIARCHTIGKLMQLTIGVKAHYGIEFISENFDKLSDEEKTKVIIHELMHIPKSFGGGFKHHDYVCDKNINMFYNKLNSLNIRNNENKKLKDFFWQ
ncbi:MAG: putative metallopeptidase [Candidatus Pacearchaeota archaeon]